MMRWALCVVTLGAIVLEGKSDDLKNFNQEKDWSSANSVYDFHAKDIDGNDLPLSKFKGFPMVITNVASNCTLTDEQYKQLQSLYETHGEKDGLKILAFPCNQFAGQEPGSSKEIKDFVKKFNVSFAMFEKIEVNGENAHPLWKWMKSQPKGVGPNGTQEIEWNFAKFVVDKKGQIYKRFGSRVEPKAMLSDLTTIFGQSA